MKASCTQYERDQFLKEGEREGKGEELSNEIKSSGKHFKL